MLNRSSFGPYCLLVLAIYGQPSWAAPPVGRTVSGSVPIQHASCLGAGQPAVVYEEGETFYDESCATSGDCASDVLSTCGPSWSAGVEFTLLRPHFDNNVAFTTLNSDGDTFESFSETDFAFDRELAPRVWLEAIGAGSLGVRAVFWQFDHGAATATGTPPANGFGRIIPPNFGDIDLSTTIPGSQYTADSAINAYTVDLELTKSVDWGRCAFVTAVGLRYAEIEQSYLSSLRSDADVLQGTLNFMHGVKGLGPTIAVLSQRPFADQWNIFGAARGSLVYGNGSSTLTAIEDQDLDSQLTTNRSSNRDAFIPIGELQVGVQWTPSNVGAFSPYMHLALESQLWSGVGNASSTEGNMGFFGFNVALGFNF